ncbi:hypothetical protein SUGI_0920790 [Cryptomeria japonica]|uniref:putative ABC transporter C family member 15 n=1 Tax=Cryptomeria japonica TaxID=3369 RepID=UPI002414B2DD|nr:putative ABC transporter C family member 15 [Cryptomeria japonica]XP_057831443.2 putative ABC transporter C family member 15 [Cryptomeria japonica]XP_057831444.2 putative ABC transporter C family member 15 [Cryptomeria japonica]XP_057831445.2 putative ABC transporter C family member 15 [Cryptomeria japonica]XP_057831447.2 putative ABC transporter C family member 15 [Cryptomeria japonica]GLJ44146.1 hypothetical protein SUGI_0920790 [Cryptomeria japonica]
MRKKLSVAQFWLASSSLMVNSGFIAFLGWLHHLLLEQKLAKLVLSATQIAFFTVFLGFGLHALLYAKYRHYHQRFFISRGNLHIVQIITTVLTVIYSGVTIYYCWVAHYDRLSHNYFPNLVYFSTQTMAWSASFILINFEKRSALSSHHFLLRGWWVVSFFTWTYQILSRGACFISDNFNLFHVVFDDYILIVTLPLVSILLVVAIKGSTKVIVTENNDNLSTNLLNNKRSTWLRQDPEGVTSYTGAGFISRFTFMWMNSLLATGYKSAIQVHEIPMLMIEDRTESVSLLLQSKLQTAGGSLALALLQSFWKQFVLTAVLAILKISVMYMGPLLIQRFIDVTSSKETIWYNGAALASILFVAKLSEVVIDHQYNFYCCKLSLAARSSMISRIYQKGLCLSNSARQSHGIGKIVNYMSVDVNEVVRIVQTIHDIWAMPIQIAIALLILFDVIRLAMVVGLLTMVFVMVLCLLVASKQQKYMVQVLACKDDRMRLTNEAISNMKIIKLQAWQEWFHKKVKAARDAERVWIMKLMYIGAMNVCMLWLSPLAVSVVSFGSCLLMKIELTPGRVFTAISTFRILQEPLRQFPSLITAAVQAAVSLIRLEKYFSSDEMNGEAVERLAVGANYALSIVEGSFKWSLEDEMPILKNINLDVRPSSLIAVVGRVGSGKSAFLSCILGEMEKVTGTVKVSGSVAYVAQSAWIQNCTIQDNILFGKDMDYARYKNTLKVCALDNDLSQMANGDKTEIGERGINLSGGQKQRIQVARAYYQSADIYLLDDIFSALDAHTGTHLFKECIRGALKDKTVVLVTHQVEFLREADLIIVMNEGCIISSGTYNELSLDANFGALVNAHRKALDDVTVKCDSDCYTDREDDICQQSCSIETGPSTSVNPSLQKQVGGNVLPNQGLVELKKEACDMKEMENESDGHCASTLIDEEERAVGRVNMSIYLAYWTMSFQGLHVIVLVVIQICWQALQILSDFWLAFFTSEGKASMKPRRFISIYSYLAFGSGFFVLIRTLLIAFSGLRTAQKFYVNMLNSVFQASMSFFDTTPSGRILTRSSTDQGTLDFAIPMIYGSTLAVSFQLLGVLFVTCQVTWQMLFVIFPLGYVYIVYMKYYLSTSRELTRLDSITTAPIMANFSETLTGITTIRAFCHEERFRLINNKLVDTNMCIDFHNFAASEWLGFRIESIGNIILCSSALLLVLLPKGIIKPEYVGLSLSYGLSLNGCIFFLVYCICQIEQSMVAVERILQYCRIPSEASLVLPKKHPEKCWPSQGSIIIDHLQLRYLPEAPLVLKDLTFSIKGGEKLGIVGRTGSGKSSLVLTLFRIVEPTAGKIIIDGIDISTVGLNELRTRISIIPQEPTLFQGTIRNNLDPLGVHTDEEIWKTLEKCLLTDVISQKEEKLDAPVSENGDNWSMGQRQLICLGRVILRQSRIVILDEATASIDTETDLLLQNIIKTEFADCTVIIIAHRVPNVMGCDNILVLDAGKAREFGSPTSLLKQSSSIFKSLVTEYWNRSRSHDAESI